MVVVKKKRTTLETDIEADLKLKGAGKYQIDTGIGFLDHMLQLWCKHGFLIYSLKLRVILKLMLTIQQKTSVFCWGKC